MEKIELLQSSIEIDGTYQILDDIRRFNTVEVILGKKYEDFAVEATAASGPGNEIVNLSGYSLIPKMASDEEQGYLLTCSSAANADRRPWESFAHTLDQAHGWTPPRGGAVGSWIQIQKLEGSIRTNMMTLYLGNHATGGLIPTHLRILGSNNGTDWDVIVDDPVKRVTVSSGSGEYGCATYYLDDYVEYSYIRMVTVASSGVYTMVPAFLIQDTALHMYTGGQHDVPIVRTKQPDESIVTHTCELTTGEGSLEIVEDQITVVGLTVASIVGSPIVHISRTYVKDEQTGAVVPLMIDPSEIAAGDITLRAWLEGSYTKEQVTNMVSGLVLLGRYDNVESLPTGSPVGTLCLVGLEGSSSFEEYVVSADLTWEIVGPVQITETDLIGYSTIEKLTELLATSSDTLQSSLSSTRVQIESELDVSRNFTVLKEIMVVDKLPSEWPTELSPSGTLWVETVKTEPWVAPELSSDGTPFVDEYAVSISSPYNSSVEPYKLTLDHTVVQSEVVKLNQGFYMTVKDEVCPTNLTLINRITSSGSYGYNVTTFKLEAKDTKGDWIVLFEGSNPDTGYGVRNEIPIDCEEFYHEFRFVPTDCVAGSSGKLPHIATIRLSGNKVKS